MKYRLGDICTIVKGTTGIMKAVPGPYPMVTLAQERKQHDEYQFDAAAVIVPLISSTGHGHASIKRIHYQEGKFALGTILCAVIPKGESLLNPRYLFIYLQQLKDSVLVPLMKGAANVSLPLNKLASLEIEVPSLTKQQEVIDLAHTLTGYKNDLETLLDTQEADTIKLRQALLRDAMQGQLLPQDPTDEPAALLLKKLQATKAAMVKGGKSKAGTLFAEEAGATKELFDVPEQWKWCQFNIIVESSLSGLERSRELQSQLGAFAYLKMNDILEFGQCNNTGLARVSADEEEVLKYSLSEGDFLFNTRNSRELVGKSCVFTGSDTNTLFNNNILRVRFRTGVLSSFVNYFFASHFAKEELYLLASATTNVAAIYQGQLMAFPVPLPPLAEQHRIVAKLEQLLQHCDALEQRIRESRRLAEQLLQTALREALAPSAGTEEATEEITTEPGPSTHRRGAQLALTDLFE